MSTSMTLDERISSAIQPASDFVAGLIFYSVPVAGTAFPLIVGWLIIAAIIFTFYFRFIQIRGSSTPSTSCAGAMPTPSTRVKSRPFRR